MEVAIALATAVCTSAAALYWSGQYAEWKKRAEDAEFMAEARLWLLRDISRDLGEAGMTIFTLNEKLAAANRRQPQTELSRHEWN